MATSTHENQIVIIETTKDDSEQLHQLLTGLTYPMNFECAQNGTDALGDIEWPEAPGFYIWTGLIWYDDGYGSGEYGGQGDPDGGVEGELRPATPTEIEAHRLGFAGTVAWIDSLYEGK